LNDTLTGIARKFNITLEELVSANPSVGSQALTVGLVLIIPPQQKAGSEPTATPWPVSIQQTNCYPNQDGSLWCLVLLKNENTVSLQNLSIEISLVNLTGEVVSEKTAYAPLDLLPSGKVTALGALFTAFIPDDYLIQTQILSASILPSIDSHYLPVHLQNYLVQVDWEGISARVSGQVFLDERSDPAERIWILAIAYDRSRNVIGFRRWDYNDPLSPDDVLSFEFEVSSLGPGIDHIDLLVEATK
jgi:LysM repeat protein